MEVIIDPRPQHAAYYAGCDYLTPNWKESQELIGAVERAPTPEHIDDSCAVLRRILEELP